MLIESGTNPAHEKIGETAELLNQGMPNQREQVKWKKEESMPTPKIRS